MTESSRLKVGELARRTGITVRTLHHYDELGLLPARRSPSGHRLYGREELRRLQRILSLRRLGFSLEEIASCLDDPAFSLERTIGLHRARLDESIERMRRLRERLQRLESAVRTESDSAEEILRTIEVTMSVEKYYTAEQLERLAARRAEVGEDRIEDIQNRWRELAAQVNRAMEEGVDASDRRVLALARRWRALTRETIAGFTGGDPGVEASLRRVWREEPDLGSDWGMGREVREYIGRALASLDPGSGEE